MQKRLLGVLRCPACGGTLDGIPFGPVSDDHIVDGLLICICGEQFPIIDRVPRLLLGDLLRSAVAAHPDFLKRFGARCRLPVMDPPSSAERQKRRTQASFGYEWTTFARYEVDNFSHFVRPLGEKFFGGRFGLDVGCGAGRHIERATALGGEVVGVDLSQAVDVAVRRNDGNRATHFVQADIFRLPFRPEAFDFIYSLGVLHHLPDPEEGFRQLVRYMKPDAPLFIWVYQRKRRKELLEHLRRLTTHLPLPLIRVVSWLATLVDYGLLVNLYRLLRPIPLIEGRIPLRVKEYAGYDFYSSYTDWFDRLSAPISHFYHREDIRVWYERAGLIQIDTAHVDDSWVWAIGRRSTSCIS